MAEKKSLYFAYADIVRKSWHAPRGSPPVKQVKITT